MKLIYLINVILISIIHAEIALDSASNALNQFGLKLLAETNGKLSENINLAISPYTVWTAMSIVNEGAMRNTAAQLENVLYIPPNNGTDRQAFRKLQQRMVQQITKNEEWVTLEILNAMFTRREAILNQNFIDLTQDIYNVRVEPLDFKKPAIAADRINKVVSDATHGKIPEIIDAAKVEDAYMFITSVLFFKGLWDKKFDKADTKLEPFYNERREEIATVPMMHTSGAFPFGQILNGKAIAVELPYIENKISMVAILPKNDVPLATVLNALAETSIPQLVESLNKTKLAFSTTDIMVELPRFKISSSLNLNIVLSALGATDVFHSGRSNLTGISSVSPLFISRLYHQTEIDVDEDGTGNNVSMILVRPRQDKKSLTMILNDLAEIPFNKIYNEIHKYDNMTALLGDDTIKLFLPRFEISSTFNLNEVLDAMGIKDVFNERDADLDNIAQNVELYVS
ncbi:Serpin (serine protease inhibitor) [Popillia japonica]|uniref:Serpin (Serine protease inhibitor) n=1 Tax=Popillia japonica TaxID=7064 RepID=A0AAW1JVD4_POPJA